MSFKALQCFRSILIGDLRLIIFLFKRIQFCDCDIDVEFSKLPHFYTPGQGEIVAGSNHCLAFWPEYLTTDDFTKAFKSSLIQWSKHFLWLKLQVVCNEQIFCWENLNSDWGGQRYVWYFALAIMEGMEFIIHYSSKQFWIEGKKLSWKGREILIEIDLQNTT